MTTAGKRKVSLVLDPVLGDRLERLALLRDQSLNKLCAELIVAGESLVHEEARLDAVGMLRESLRVGQRDLEGTVIAEVRKMSGRLASLLARTALEATATRAFQLQLAALEVGNKHDFARLKESAWRSAVGSLNDPTPAVREGLEVLVSGVAISGTDALPRVLGQVESLVAKLEGNLGKFGETVGQGLNSMSRELTDLKREVSGLSSGVAGMRNDLSKPKGLFGR